MKKERFCVPENLSVILPYRDYEKLVGMATNYDALLTKFSQLEKQVDALRGMYREALDKIAEINVYL